MGVNAAKGVAAASGLPLVAVNHLEAHVYSVFLDPVSKTQLAVGNPKELRDHHPDESVRTFLRRGVAQADAA